MDIFTHLFIDDEDYRPPMLIVTGAKLRHLARARRIRVGEMLCASLPSGMVLRGKVEEITADSLIARIETKEAAIGISPCRITLFQAMLKSDKNELVIQKAAELGATALVPLFARRSIPQWPAKKTAERIGRWQRIADAASEQCERSIPLIVEMPLTLTDAIADAPGMRILLHERRGQPLNEIHRQHQNAREISLFVGPEGGWDDAEAELLLNAGAHAVNLGPRVLRAETAGIVGVALTQYLWGDLGRSNLDRQ